MFERRHWFVLMTPSTNETLMDVPQSGGADCELQSGCSSTSFHEAGVAVLSSLRGELPQVLRERLQALLLQRQHGLRGCTLLVCISS